MNSDMSMRVMASSVSNRNSGQRLGEFGLAHPGRPQEQKRTVGPLGIGEPGAGPPDRVGDRSQRLPLADHPVLQQTPPSGEVSRARLRASW